jgi:hypothetical protein
VRHGIDDPRPGDRGLKKQHDPHPDDESPVDLISAVQTPVQGFV